MQKSDLTVDIKGSRFGGQLFFNPRLALDYTAPNSVSHKNIEEYNMLRRITISRVEWSPVVLKRLFGLLVTMMLVVSAPVVFTGCDSGPAAITDNGSNDEDGDGSDDEDDGGGDEDDDGNGNTSQWTALGEGTSGFRLSGVYALALGDGNDVYIGGQFPNAGGTPVNSVALWDGSSWSALGAGLDSGGFGRVNALVIDEEEGVLYAGGAFDNSGSTVLSGPVAKWDGETWSSVGGDDFARLIFGSSASLIVNAMALGPEGNLYVAGDISVGFFSQRVGVVKWDGSEWSLLADPNVEQDVGGGISGEVKAIIVDDSGVVYAGGSFLEASGRRVNNLAYWNGETWSDLGGGVDGTVYSLALGEDGDLVVSGAFSSAGNIVADNIARWDDSEWSAFANENPAALALAHGPDGQLYAGGYFSGELVSRWTGTEWEGIGSGSLLDQAPLTTMQFDPSGYLYVGGNFSVIDGVEANGVARWDGLVE